MLLLDTDTLVPADRAEALVAATQYAHIPASLTHQVPEPEVHAKIDFWELGGGLSLMRHTSSGLRLTRTSKQVRQVAEDRLAVTLIGPGSWRFVQGAHEQVERAVTWKAVAADQSAPYEWTRPGAGDTLAFGMDHDAYELPVEELRRAAARIECSPLLPMVMQHLLNVARIIDTVPIGAVTMIGTASAELVRALMLSARAGEAPAPQLSADGLLTRTQLYLQAHIADQNLTPAGVARAHNISVRQLYGVWAQHEPSLAGYVMFLRLELARERLARRGARARTIAAIARDCGFVDAGHFSRRFRTAYGFSPREWRELSGP